MIKKAFFLVSFLLLFTIHLRAQKEAIAIGKVNNAVLELNENQPHLTKAFEWVFKDGTKVLELKIEQLSNQYYLMATCNYQGKKRIAAVFIELVGSEFIIKEEAAFTSCSAVACENCRFFFENNKIVACKCDEKGTISNHCHFKAVAQGIFYANFVRALKMSDQH